MSKARVLIVRTAGTNCDQETRYAFELAGAEVSLVHTNKLLAAPTLLKDYHVFVIPGGFTYGDDIAAGRVLANELRALMQDELISHVRRGGLVLGICNGFQVLVKTGLLPGFNIVDDRSGGPSLSAGREDARAGRARGEGGSGELFPQQVTLMFNDSNRYEDRWVYLKVCTEKSEFINNKYAETVYLPVAHGEGKFVPLDEGVLTRLKDQDQIVLRYTLPPGVEPGGQKVSYPYDPNGSVDHVAGICDPTGRILGLMPHPERYVHPSSHPRWTREGLKETPDGFGFFTRAVQYVRRTF